MEELQAGVTIERHARVIGGLKVALGALLLPVYVGCPFAWVLLLALLSSVERGRRRVAKHKGRAKKATVTADEHAIVIATARGNERIERSELRGGWVERVGEGYAAVMPLSRDRTLLAYTDAYEDAAALLEAAGVGPRQHTLRIGLGTLAAADGQGAVMHLLAPWLVVVMSLTFLMALGAMAFALHPVIGLFASLGLLALTMFAWLTFARYVFPMRCTVGSDALVVEQLFRRRVIPMADLGAVERRSREVVLQTAQGPLRLPTALSPGDPGADAGDALEWRLDEARKAARIDETGERYRALDRDGRTLASWRTGLASFAATGSYRTTDFASEELLRVAESSAAPLERRLGAVLVLAQRGLEASQEKRVRVAAEAIADPRVRVAVEKAAEGTLDDEDVEEAARAQMSLRGTP